MGEDLNDWFKTMTDDEINAGHARAWQEQKAAGEEADFEPKDEGGATSEPMPRELVALDWRACAGTPAPPRRWIVPGWIPDGAATALYGNGGIGKSLLAQQLLTAVATGQPWLGLPVARGPALGLFCEDDHDELWRRQDAINEALGLDWADLGDLRLVPRVGADNALMTFTRDGRGALTPLYFELTRQARAQGARLVVVDTAADAFEGNENDRQQVRRFIGALTRLALAIEGAVVPLAHPSRAGLTSGAGDGGSTAWHNSVRARLYLTRPADGDDPDARVLRGMKANYGPTGDEIALRWRRGVFVRDGGDGGLVAALDRRAEERAAEAAFLACLRKLRAAGRYASVTEAARDRYAPKLIRTLPEGRTHSLKALREAMERLFAAGQIRVESVRASNRHPIAAIVEVD